MHRLERQIAWLTVRVERLANTHGAAPAVPLVDPSIIDRLAKDQTALAHRLLSIEQTLARQFNADPSHAASPRSTDSAQFHDAPASKISNSACTHTTVAFEDVGLHLTTGPYGRFLVMTSDLDDAAPGHDNRHLQPIIERCATQGNAAVEVGTHVGFLTVCMARHFNRIHAFEPLPRSFQLLNANLALNGCNHVSTYNLLPCDPELAMALANDALQGIAACRRGSTPNDAMVGNVAVLACTDAAEQSHAPRRIATIDGLRLDDVGLIRLDTKGCDLRVLQGARRTIDTARPTIAFASEQYEAGRGGDTLDDVRRFFADCDYSLTQIADARPNRRDFLATPN
jgi:FkbM family methyltransferase